MNFLRLKKSKIVILPAPYEHTTSYIKGTILGPEKLIEASHQVELYDEEFDIELYREVGIATLEPLDFTDLKDEKAVELVYKFVLELLKKDKFVVTIGGEHTIAIGAIKAYSEIYPNLTILHFDAHSDLRDEYERNKYSHASALARVFEFNKNLVQVGIRAQDVEEAKFIKENGIKTFYAWEIKSGLYNKDGKSWQDAVISELGENVYITFDLDYFDPSVMPAVGTPVPNGLYWDETIELLKKVSKSRNIVGFDIVELCPLPGIEYPNFTSAFFTNKLLNIIFANKIKRRD
ncbi:agmatinase [Candidatus Chrysopegis kryptomonas]|uniref:Agmatinase n=1 Tax=Candidatus Chryseopegocella kryptomonas TaxID=1633643 RepID=A0A0P1NTU6_9BACT|nr:agmatinase [Candidatus Chrysopegis kryptomonas]CUT02400.1 agmatinase [Candidatus Chrysopegis kryptomonas]